MFAYRLNPSLKLEHLAPRAGEPRVDGHERTYFRGNDFLNNKNTTFSNACQFYGIRIIRTLFNAVSCLPF